MNDQEIIDDLNTEFIKPAPIFKGWEIRPKTLRNTLLLGQALRKLEPPITGSVYCAVYFYVHTQPIKEVEAAVFSGNAVSKALEFIDGFTESDIEEISAIILDFNKSEENSKVEVQSESNALPDPHLGNE